MHSNVLIAIDFKPNGNNPHLKVAGILYKHL